MLGKRYSLGSKDELTGEARVKLANFDELKSQGDAIANFLNSFNPDSGFVYLHVIAMGAGEYYGCNINGDYFPERDLINRHKTFETNAKVFKEHDNKPYSPDYGHVAFSWYNKKMHRVELILAIDKVKGKEFIDRQARGEQLEVSMGCKVAYDVCSICGNKAKKRSDYCDHIRYHKKEIYPDGKQPYMINYNPTFFDISIVKRRADRIAYVLSKVASTENSFSSSAYEEFDNLDQDCIIPDAPEPEIFDIEDDLGAEKVASLPDLYGAESTLLDKVAMIKRINSNAVRVMNKGIEKLIPMLEQVEPDINPRVLDKIAIKHSIPDILKSFMMNAVPMKPREFTRIIIVKQGLPLSSFDDVLRGVLSATPSMLPSASYRHDIGELLEPYLESRSSYLPAIIDRTKKLFGIQKTASPLDIDIYNSYNKLNPALNFGYVRSEYPQNTLAATLPDRGYTVVQHNTMESLPVIMSAEALERERRRPELREPRLNPFETGLALGGLFAASKGMDGFLSYCQNNPSLPIIGSLAALFYAKKKMQPPHYLQKVSSINGASKYVLPFVGTHLLSAYYRNEYDHGEELSNTERFIAENPDIISIAAPLAIGIALNNHSSVTPQVKKVAGIINSNDIKDISAEHGDIVEFADLTAYLAIK